MTKIKLVDSRMGRGKTSAAIQYMESNKKSKRFVYITPFLDEVDRICERCSFDQPDGEDNPKIVELKRMLHQRRNLATTHVLYSMLDSEALEIIREKHYTLIIDESIEVISKVAVTAKDLQLITDTLATVDAEGFVHWIDSEYSGRFSGYKQMADTGSLVVLDTALFSIMRPDMLKAFDEVIMMSYLFGGQAQKAYLDYYGFEYQICGIDNTNGFRFTDTPDAPPPIDYKRLVTIIQDTKLNEIGKNRCSLSANWYKAHGRDSTEIKRLRNNMNTFFRRRTESGTDKQLWTCFKSDASKLIMTDGRHRNSFLQLSARATNEYKDRYCLAYMVNRFIDPNITKFFAQRGVSIDADEFALGEMLQWIWRSRIRDNEPIELYIPSKRMRDLLIDWIDKNSKGDNT